MDVSPRTLAIASGIAALVAGVAFAIGHRGGRKREQTLNLARYRYRNRVLLIFAPSRNDGRYLRQMRELGGMVDELEERDMVELHVLASGSGGSVKPGDGSLLRTLFHVRRGSFRIVLVGKDGHTALDSSSPVSAKEIFRLIDAMPMRKQELRRKAALR